VSANDATQVLRIPRADNTHVRRLDDVWLLTLLAASLAAVLPWFLSGYRLDLASILGGLAALCALHLALAAAAVRPQHWLASGRALGLLHALGVVALGFVWLRAGGLQNPMFLLVFVLPVIGGIFISVWQPYVTAVFASVVVSTLALSHQPELRWYAEAQTGVRGWLSALPMAGGTTPFLGFFAPSGYYLVVLETFAVLLFGCAVTAAGAAALLARSAVQTRTAAAAAEDAHELCSSLMRNLPAPALLVEADTLRVVQVSEQLTADFAITDVAPPGAGKLLELLRFSYPEIVEQLITGTGGRERPCVVRSNGRLLATEVRVQHLMYAGRRHALVLIEDLTELLCVTAAFDAADYAALIIDAQGRVMGFNRAARGLFSGVAVGSRAGFLSQLASGERWWEPGLSGRRKLQLKVLGRTYQVTSSAVALPGEAESICVLAFFPMATVSVDDTSATVVTRALR
jgi:hypothetical protein